jgi:hypothetical protein
MNFSNIARVGLSLCIVRVFLRGLGAIRQPVVMAWGMERQARWATGDDVDARR